MLEIFCAIYPEASALIQSLSLKKEERKDLWDHFINEEKNIRLTLTGSGKVRAASAVTAVLLHDPDPYVLFFGSAAYLKDDHELLYLADRIEDIDTGRIFYPDLLYSFSLPECGILSGSRLLSESKTDRSSLKEPFELNGYLESICSQEPDYLLYDLEASAVYEAANAFVGPHAISITAFASDRDASTVNAEDIRQKAEKALEKLLDLISVIQKSRQKKTVIPDEKNFKEHLHASLSMQRQIDQIIHYCICAGIDYQKIMNEEMKKETADRNEGKRVLDEFRKKCCEE